MTGRDGKGIGVDSGRSWGRADSDRYSDVDYVPSTGKSSNSSSSSSRAVLVCVGFDVVAASAVVDLEACSFAVGFVEDILT